MGIILISLEITWAWDTEYYLDSVGWKKEGEMQIDWRKPNERIPFTFEMKRIVAFWPALGLGINNSHSEWDPLFLIVLFPLEVNWKDITGKISLYFRSVRLIKRNTGPKSVFAQIVEWFPSLEVNREDLTRAFFAWLRPDSPRFLHFWAHRSLEKTSWKRKNKTRPDSNDCLVVDMTWMMTSKGVHLTSHSKITIASSILSQLCFLTVNKAL